MIVLKDGYMLLVLPSSPVIIIIVSLAVYSSALQGRISRSVPLFASPQEKGLMRQLLIATAGRHYAGSRRHLISASSKLVIPTSRLKTTAPTTLRTALSSPAVAAYGNAILEQEKAQNPQRTKQIYEPIINHQSSDYSLESFLLGLKSRPVPGGNWNPPDPLKWTKNFGKRSHQKQQYYEKVCRLKPGDESYTNSLSSSQSVEGVTIIQTREDALVALAALMASPESTYHACDTEVMDIDLNKEGPVGNGYVTCLSIYSGPTFDYGLNNSIGTALWIDNLDDSFGLIQLFKPFLESPTHKKVWHNYGFDRHVLFNEGIDVQGLGADTMHMARLWDTSRARMAERSNGNPYSLESLTNDLIGNKKTSMKEMFGLRRLRKDGSEGSLVDIPPVEVLQRDPKHRPRWILYSSYDAQSTWYLRQALQSRLQKKAWYKDCSMYDYYQMYMVEFAQVLTDMERRGMRVNAKDYLAKVEVQAREEREYHVATFRNWAAGILGADGLAMNPASAAQLSTFLFGGYPNQVTKQPTETERIFKTSLDEVPEEAIRAFEEREQRKRKSLFFYDENENKSVIDEMTLIQLKKMCKEKGLKVSGKKADLQERLRQHYRSSSSNTEEQIAWTNNLNPAPQQDEFDAMSDDDLRHTCISRSLDSQGNRAKMLYELRKDIHSQQKIWALTPAPQSQEGYKKLEEILDRAAESDEQLAEVLNELNEKRNATVKHIDVKIKSIGMVPEKFTSGGAPSVTADVLRGLAGDPFSDPPKYGKAYKFFKTHEEGHDACVGLYSLTAIGSIDTMIANFLSSLQSRVDEQSRVHCSLNFNTETGRLSSRGPNLQNQPALEKDKYKIRKAFESSPKNNLIVADYGQLELRLLASMTNCQSMIDAFKLGGDFHSRTAMNMFDYIQKKVDDGDILFEWDYSKGSPPKPLLKDVYASERRKAKTLNFSIAYGKTAHGLSAVSGLDFFFHFIFLKTKILNVIEHFYLTLYNFYK